MGAPTVWLSLCESSVGASRVVMGPVLGGERAGDVPGVVGTAWDV